MSKWTNIGLYTNSAKTNTMRSSSDFSGGSKDSKPTIASEPWYLFLALLGIFPARLNAVQTAWVLGFQPHHMAILIRAGLLRPLGSALPMRERWFATVSVLELAQDEQFLAKATNAVYEHSERENGERSEKS